MKNVLAIYLDDMNTDEWQALTALLAEPYGHWVKFPNYVMSTPVCGPSRASFMTGLHAQHTGVHINPDFEKMDFSNMLPVWISSDGTTRAAIFGKFGNGFPAPGLVPDQTNPLYFPPGWTNGKIYANSQNYLDFTLRSAGGGGEQLYPHNVSIGAGQPTAGSDGELNYSADVLFYYARQFMTQHVADPWFCFVTPVSPHRDTRTAGEQDNYAVPATRYAGSYASLKKLRCVSGSPTYEYLPSYNYLGGAHPVTGVHYMRKPTWMQNAYTAPNMPINHNLDSAGVLADALDSDRIKSWESLRATDEQIKRTLDLLSQLGELDKTCVIVTSDNGFCHGHYRHSGKLIPYEPSLTTKAMVRHPSATPHVDPHVISNVDMAATVMHLMGKTPPPMDGESFAGCLDPTLARPVRESHLIMLRGTGGSQTPDTVALANAGYSTSTTWTTDVPPWWGIRSSRITYIEWDSGERELYDLNTDPYQLDSKIDIATGIAVGGYRDMAAAAKEWLARLKAREPFREFPIDSKLT